MMEEYKYPPHSISKQGGQTLQMAIKISKGMLAIMAIVICCTGFVAAQHFLKSGHTNIVINEPVSDISLDDALFEGIYPGDTVNQNWTLVNNGNVPITIMAIWEPDNGTLSTSDYTTNLPKNWTVQPDTTGNMTVFWNISAGADIQNLSGTILLERI